MAAQTISKASTPTIDNLLEQYGRAYIEHHSMTNEYRYCRMLVETIVYINEDDVHVPDVIRDRFPEITINRNQIDDMNSWADRMIAAKAIMDEAAQRVIDLVDAR